MDINELKDELLEYFEQNQRNATWFSRQCKAMGSGVSHSTVKCKGFLVFIQAAGIIPRTVKISNVIQLR